MNEACYKKYLIVVLSTVFSFSCVDRMVLGLVTQDIERDLSLSDTQFGLLSGIAFAMFYSVAGIPLARWADRGNRARIVSVTTALWSVAVALCGVAGSFMQLLLIRVGVAVGESGCVTTAISLIGDHFGRMERTRAVSRFLLGGPSAYVIGYFFGGWLNERYGWRATFMILGAPGIGLAALALLTLREPRLERTIPTSKKHSWTILTRKGEMSSPVQAGLKDVCVALFGNSTYRQLMISYAVMTFAVSGVSQWLPTVFARGFGLGTAELGTWFAAIFTGSVMLGVYVGGALASRYAAANERLQLRAMIWTNLISGLSATLIYFSPTHYMAFGLLAVSLFFNTLSTGPLLAVIQLLVPKWMRAQSIAFLYLSANLLGNGLGPWVAGVLSDTLRPWVGQGALRDALLVLSPCYLWSAWHLWLASTTVAGDLRAASADDCNPADGPNSRNVGGQQAHVL